MHDDDFDLFRQEMKGVKRIKTKERVEPPKPAVPEPALIHRRQMAVQVRQGDDNHLTEEIIDLVHPLDILEYRTDGVSHGVFRKLKRGQYPIDARLDLHRKSMAEARAEVFGFVADCLKYDVRSAMILHGKGERGEPKAFLKSCVNTWLKQMPEVLAFHSAQKHHGGVGALYVLLRKSESKKAENRERFMKGRTE
ncbi:DNA endonuclease SmrA [Saccharospirillum salsuginis]|uniref:Smr domain protein n=1 Tax=Saccharospirillum salsuginis TaxID=418750 RepID=A0A918K7Y6_9GAMM|nr:DNA endonuclease SmrA [Saccharospirillum salsuginis]GGX53858.1 Smr domain protein [Saccharospirillum salsuginis]